MPSVTQSDLLAELTLLLQSSHSGIWLQTVEPAEVTLALNRLAEQQDKWEFLFWNRVEAVRIVTGQESREYSTVAPSMPGMPMLAGFPGAMSAFSFLTDIYIELQNRQRALDEAESLDREEPQYSRRIYVLANSHLEIRPDDAAMIQLLQRILDMGRSLRVSLIMVSRHSVHPCRDLQELFVPADHSLPEQNERMDIVRSLLSDNQDEEIVAVAASSLSGLTRAQVENTAALSLVKYGRLDATFLAETKVSLINSSGLLTLHPAGSTFDQLGGLTGLKNFLTGLLSDPAKDKAQPRGVVLFGVPGSGKTAIAMAAGGELQRPTVVLSVGKLMGSLVGETEHATREALRIVDAIAPAILVLDEAEKALGGAGDRDGGVNSRLRGTLLSWMSDRKSDVFLVMTANNISALPAEFLRMERQDAVFFVDVPSSAGRREIWNIYLEHYELPAQELPDDEDWTGAEIKSCCRLAYLMNLSLRQAAKQIIPVAKASVEVFREARAWATQRALDAETGLVYTGEPAVSGYTPSTTKVVTQRKRRLNDHN